MNYQNIYENIINNAKSQQRENKGKIKYNNHHIFPKCWCIYELKYLKTDKRNLVLLTVKEHFICHWLLAKIFGNEMHYAFWRMCNNHKHHLYKMNSKIYNNAKKNLSNLNYQSSKICLKCGQIVCKNKNICDKKQMINTLIKYFGFNKNVLGTEEIYNEYNKTKDIIYKEYHVNKLSTLDIKTKYNITSTQRVDSIFKSLNIPKRNFKEAFKNYVVNN